jgi:hypothetical protein
LGALPREAARGSFFWVKHKTLEKRNEERHGAIDRKRGVKTPTKA